MGEHSWDQRTLVGDTVGFAKGLLQGWNYR